MTEAYSTKGSIFDASRTRTGAFPSMTAIPTKLTIREPMNTPELDAYSRSLGRRPFTVGEDFAPVSRITGGR